MREIIRLEGVKKHYCVESQTVRALDGIDLTIRQNDYLAIMGPSGSGKSTLMNILGCLDTPTEGVCLFNGEDVRKMDDDRLSSVRGGEIGFVFQSFNLLPRMNSLENVALPLLYAGVPHEERMMRAEAALEMVGLLGRKSHKPSELSGGQRQRVAIARALVSSPSVILADEPTGNLDSRTSVEIMKLFDEIHRKGNTIILVTHEEEIARYAERTITIRDGLIESSYENLHQDR